MLRFFASFAIVLGLSVALAVSAHAAREPDALLTIEPGADARSLDELAAIPGATVLYDEAARVVYHGDAPATVSIRLVGGPAWKLATPALVPMTPGQALPVAIEIALADGDAAPGPARLIADVLPQPSPLPTR